MVRIKKKEIEQDKFITYCMNVISWIKENSQTFFAILIGIALGIAVIFFYKSYKSESQQASVDLLNKADEMYYRNISAISEKPSSETKEPVSSGLNTVELDEAIKKYDDLIEEYPSSYAAEFALLNKGNAAFLTKKFDVAINAYNEFLGKNVDSPINEIVQENLISAYIGKKDYDTSIKEINNFIKKSKRDEFKAGLLLRLGNIYEFKNDTQNAINTYKKITEEYKDSPSSNQATSQLKLLETIKPLPKSDTVK
jgi:predicted negative regulator of RcsB-dependent stress response